MECFGSYEYCYDRENKNLLVRYSEDGTLEKYVYGNGLIASSETRESQSPKYRTYLYDLRGSVTFTLDSSANITSEYRYSTYGNRNVIKGSTTSELGYCARDGVLTEVTGLLYMRARYYYPNLMRFINQDIVTGDISNSNSLNRYTYVEGNPATMIDPFGLCAEKISALTDLLINCGWSETKIAAQKISVVDLYNTLLKYDILSREQICMFLAQCQYESGGGEYTVEIGDETYFNSLGYTTTTSGCGYIQMSNDYEYQAYAIYLILENYPELREDYTYLSPAHHYGKDINNLYNEVKEEAEKRGLNISTFTYAYESDYRREFIASFYPWDSAGYYWSLGKELNQAVADGASINDISTAVKGNSSANKERKDVYDIVVSEYDKMNFSKIFP